MSYKRTMPIHIRRPNGVDSSIGTLEIEERDGEVIISGVIDDTWVNVIDEDLYGGEMVFWVAPAVRTIFQDNLKAFKEEALNPENRIIRGGN